MIRRILTNVSVLAAMALVVSGCDKKDAPKGGGATIGFVYVGPRTDYGYNYAMDQGRLALEKDLGVKTAYFENIPENAEVQRVMERMIGDGIKIIFATSYGYLDPALEVAAKHPDVVFMHGGGFKLAPNLGTFFADIDEVEFLSGMAAGASTKTGKLGFIAAHPIPQTLRNINAFTRGARLVSPKVTMNVVWTGSWSDPTKEAEAANTLADQGVDVLTMHVDVPITIAQIAEKRGIMVCGYHADASQFAPKGWITGAAWNWGPLMEKIVKSIKDSSWKSANLRGNIRDGYVQLAAFGPAVPASIKPRIDSAKKAFEGGSPLWIGPLVAQDGSIKAKAGDTLGRAKVESMDFLVQGVVGSVK